MGLAEKLQSTKPKARGSACWYKSLVARIDEAEREVLDEALRDRKSYTNAQLEEALGEEYGIEVKSSTIGNHRRGDCACAKYGV